MKKGPLIIVRILALVGLVISSWLLWQKASGQISSIAGCGEGSGCANVLGSRWSQVFLIPVTVFSVAVYAGLLGMTFRPRALPLFIAGVLLIGAAVWFSGLQAFVLKSFCPWCLATHTIGLLCGTTILLGLDARPARPALPLVMAGLLLGILILGQVFGPRPATFLITEETVEMSGEPNRSGGDPDFRQISFFGGTKTYNLDELPRIGPLDAPHVMVKYFDYLCASCASMHGDLKALQSAYPGQVTVIMLPTPLNRSCNPNMTSGMKDHAGACDVARLVLAAWRSEPESFEAIHEALFAAFPPTPKSARQIVLQHLSEAELDAALADPWIDRQLNANFSDFAQLVSRTPKMPKLLIEGHTTLHGLSSSTKAFVEVVGEALGLGAKDGPVGEAPGSVVD